MQTEVIQDAFPGMMGEGPDGTLQQKIGRLAPRQMVTKWQEVPFERFKKLFEEKAGPLWSRCEHLFKEYGPVLSLPLCSALMYAQEADRLLWCVELLEQHLRDDLTYQHPDIRGRVILGSLGKKNRSVAFLESEVILVLRPDLVSKPGA